MEYTSGHSNAALYKWNSGWEMALSSTAPGVTARTVANCQGNNWAREGQNIYYGSGTGNVGIGTTSPYAKLEAQGPNIVSASPVVIKKAKLLNLSLATSAYYGGFAEFWMGRYANVSNHAKSVLTISLNDGLYGSNTNADTDVMTLRGDGNVGIGTTSPSTKLEVAGHVTINSPAGASQTSYGLRLRKTNSSSTVQAGGEILASVYPPNTNAANLIFKTANTSANLTQRMVIDGIGNVGIGTDLPTAKLQVNVGSAMALYAGNACGHVGIGVTSTDISGNGLQPQLTVKGNISYGYNNYSSVANTWSNALNFSGYPAGLYQVNICKQSNASAYIIAQVKWSGTAGTVINTVTSFQYGITFSGTQLQSIINTTTATSISVQCLVTFESCLP